MNKILCTGAPRSGTSMLALLTTYFKDLNVNHNGTPPKLFEECDIFTTQQRPDGKIWNDFIAPSSLKDILENGIKIIYIYRDGRDCLVSNRKGQEGYWYGPALKDVEKWFNSLDEFQKTQQEIKGTNLEKLFFVIKYEELVSNPEHIMGQVEKFIGSPLSPKYVNFYKDYKPGQSLSTVGAIGSEYSGLRPIGPNSFNWKKPKHKERIKTLITHYEDEITNTLMDLGYETNKNWINEYK